MVMTANFVFVFQQKPAYEMRISDLSSDVCSFDLKSSQLPRNPRRRSGAYSATKTAAPVYSPPTENPWASLHTSSRTGAHSPIDRYEGIRPMQKVLIAMMMMVSDRTFCRPKRSPMTPKKMPPSGRTRNGTENVPSAATIWTVGEDRKST